MERQDHSYEAEHAAFPLDEEGYGEPIEDDPYAYERAEERLARIEQHLAAQHEQAEQEHEKAADQGFQQLIDQYPQLATEEGSQALVDRVIELADAAVERGEIRDRAELAEDPGFVRQVWEGSEFNAGLSEADARFVQMAAEAKSNRLDWD